MQFAIDMQSRLKTKNSVQNVISSLTKDHLAIETRFFYCSYILEQETERCIEVSERLTVVRVECWCLVSVFL